MAQTTAVVCPLFCPWAGTLWTHSSLLHHASMGAWLSSGYLSQTASHPPGPLSAQTFHFTILCGAWIPRAKTEGPRLLETRHGASRAKLDSAKQDLRPAQMQGDRHTWIPPPGGRDGLGTAAGEACWQLSLETPPQETNKNS